MHIMISAGNSQVGSYLANKYLQEGHLLSLLYHRRKERIESIMLSSRVYAEAVDLAALTNLDTTIGNCCDRHGSCPDVIIHCAAVRSYDAKPLAQTDPLIFQEVLCTNVLFTYNVLRSLLPLMRERAYGRIVLFGSNVTQTGLACGSAYAAAKAAVVNLAKSVARENNDIDLIINCISPAPVETALEEDFQGEYLQFRKQYFANYLAQNPGFKLVSKEEIKEVIDMIIHSNDKSQSGKEIFLGTE